MLFLLSPAKSLDYETPVPAAVLQRATLPQFIPEAAALVDILRTKTPADIAGLMDLSDPLAALNVARFQAWSPAFDDGNSKPAVLAFNGDVYDGLDAKSLAGADLEWAQEHVAILSGLYGLLRPLDRLQPYRLEMGTKLPNPRGKGLYAYWGDRLAEALNARAAQHASPVIVNLASQEYAKAALRKSLKPRVIDCVFEDWKGHNYKIVSFWAKRARGLMARWAVQHRIDRPEGLLGFDLDGYRHEPAVSEPDRFVFRRRQEP